MPLKCKFSSPKFQESTLHIGLSHKEFVPTSSPAAILHCVGPGSLTGSCLACPINSPRRVDLHALCFTVLDRRNFPSEIQCLFTITQTGKRCNHFTKSLFKHPICPHTSALIPTILTLTSTLLFPNCSLY